MKSGSRTEHMSYSMIKRSLFDQVTKAQFDKMFQNQSYIGSGTQAQVYKANYGDKLVAIKYLRKDSISMELIDYTRSEIQTLSDLHHQNIVSFIDSYQYYLGSNSKGQKKYCIITEYCQHSLSSYHIISQLSNLKKLKMCLELVSGVKAAHEKGIIHRDIKPQNILIKDLQTLTIKLADFGCCRIEAQEDVDKTMNVGTPLYADPNIQSGKYTSKCDVYSVGLVIVYIFCGRQFFSDCDTRDKLIKAKKYFCQNTQKQARKFLKQFNLQEDIQQFLINIAFYTLSEKEENRLGSGLLYDFIKDQMANYETVKNIKSKEDSLVMASESPSELPFELPCESQDRSQSPSQKKQVSQKYSQMDTVDRLTQELKDSQHSSQQKCVSNQDFYDCNQINNLQIQNSKLFDDGKNIRDIPNVQVNMIHQSQFTKKSYIKDDEKPITKSKTKKVSQILTSRIQNQRKNLNSLFKTQRSIKDKSKLNERELKISQQLKVLKDSELLSAQLIKYSSQCAAVKDQCEKMGFILKKILFVKACFQQIKIIQEVPSYSVTFQQKQTIVFCFFALYISQLISFRNFLYGNTSKLFARFGKISEQQNKVFIQSIINKETQRIFQHLKKSTADLKRKSVLIKPKLGNVIVNLLNDITLCGTNYDLLELNLHEELILNETKNFIDEKLKEIKNQNDRVIIQELRSKSVQMVS